MSDARDEIRNGLLLDGLGKPLDLNAVDRHVRHRNPSASPSEVQNETLEVIRTLVNDGLFTLGAVGDSDRTIRRLERVAGSFDPQDLPRLRQALRRSRAVDVRGVAVAHRKG
jgi:hypothetical protein